MDFLRPYNIIIYNIFQYRQYPNSIEYPVSSIESGKIKKR